MRFEIFHRRNCEVISLVKRISSVLIRAVLGLTLTFRIGFAQLGDSGDSHLSPQSQEKMKSTDFSPSPTGALLRSLIIPGWGQLYNRKPLKATLALALEGGFAYGVYKNHLLRTYYLHRDPSLSTLYRDERNRLTWYLAGSLLLAVLDAYVDAHLYHFEVSPP